MFFCKNLFFYLPFVQKHLAGPTWGPSIFQSIAYTIKLSDSPSGLQAFIWKLRWWRMFCDHAPSSSVMPGKLNASSKWRMGLHFICLQISPEFSLLFSKWYMAFHFIYGLHFIWHLSLQRVTKSYTLIASFTCIFWISSCSCCGPPTKLTILLLFFTSEINAEVAVVKLLLSAHSLEVFFRHAFFHRGVPECEHSLVLPDDLKTHAN